MKSILSSHQASLANVQTKFDSQDNRKKPFCIEQRPEFVNDFFYCHQSRQKTQIYQFTNKYP